MNTSRRDFLAGAAAQAGDERFYRVKVSSKASESWVGAGEDALRAVVRQIT